MNGLNYIAVEGAIGVGKTSLARLISEEVGAKLICEQVDENPFLKSFYGDRKKYSFQTQTYFLLSRYKQQQELNQRDLFSSIIVSDYIFAKDRIFAHMNLDENEIALYEQIYTLLDAKLPKPDLLIYLHARPEVLRQRVEIRNREYEKNIDNKYLEALVHAYNEYFFHYDETPLLVIDSSEIDFVNNRDDFDLLIKEIREMKGGVKHFRPLGSR